MRRNILDNVIICIYFAALTVEFNPAAYSVDEGEMVELTAQLNRAADREVTVVFTTVDGNAS